MKAEIKKRVVVILNEEEVTALLNVLLSCHSIAEADTCKTIASKVRNLAAENMCSLADIKVKVEN